MTLHWPRPNMEARTTFHASGLAETAVAVLDSSSGSELHGQLEGWTAQGLLDAEQAARIEAAEAARPAPRAGSREAGPRERDPAATGAEPHATASRLPLAAEALVYAGAVFTVAAGFRAVRPLWPTISVGAESAFAGVAAAVLLLVGLLLHTDADPPSARIRSVAWLASTACFAVFVGLLVNPRFWDDGPIFRTLVTESCVAVYTVALWWRSRTTLQHLAAFFATATLLTTGVGVAIPDSRAWEAGVGIWVLSLLWGGAVHGGYLRPRTAGYSAAGIGFLVGAQLSLEPAAGQALAVLTVGGLLVAGVVLSRLLLVGLGTVGAIVILPQVLPRYLPAGIGAAAGVFAVGIVMLGVALWLVRSR